MSFQFWKSVSIDLKRTIHQAYNESDLVECLKSCNSLVYAKYQPQEKSSSSTYYSFLQHSLPLKFSFLTDLSLAKVSFASMAFIISSPRIRWDYVIIQLCQTWCRWRLDLVNLAKVRIRWSFYSTASRSSEMIKVTYTFDVYGLSPESVLDNKDSRSKNWMYFYHNNIDATTLRALITNASDLEWDAIIILSWITIKMKLIFIHTPSQS